MSFKSLNDTFIYQNLNRNNTITKMIPNILKNGKVLTQKNLEDAYNIIYKNFKFPLKHKIFEEIEEGTIVPIYSPNNIRMITSIPFFLTRNSAGKVISVILVDIYGNMSKDGENVVIDPKKLYVLLEGAYFAKLCYKYSDTISTKSHVITSGSSIYSNMFTRVLNKKYALNTDKTKLHKVLFSSSKFYLINMLGLRDDDKAFNYAFKNCIGGNHLILNDFNNLLETKDFTDLSTFIKALSSPRLGLNFKDLTVRNYIEQFIYMYDTSCLLSLESFPYFIYNILSVTNGAYINNQYILEDIVDTHGAKIYNALSSLNN